MHSICKTYILDKYFKLKFEIVYNIYTFIHFNNDMIKKNVSTLNYHLFYCNSNFFSIKVELNGNKLLNDLHAFVNFNSLEKYEFYVIKLLYLLLGHCP